MPSCRRATHALENKTFVPRLAAGSVSAVLAAGGRAHLGTSGSSTHGGLQNQTGPWGLPAAWCSSGWAGFLQAVGHCSQQGGGWSANSRVREWKCPNAQNLDMTGYKEKQAML